MAEELTLTTPISVPTYSIQKLAIDWVGATIKVILLDTNGEIVVCTYSGATATTLIQQLNKVDLSAKSLQKRVLERLVTDGKLPAGTVTGTPD